MQSGCRPCKSTVHCTYSRLFAPEAHHEATRPVVCWHSVGVQVQGMTSQHLETESERPASSSGWFSFERIPQAAFPISAARGFLHNFKLHMLGEAFAVTAF